MEIFDIAIIGAGVVGCAIAQHLAKYDVKIALLEKEADVCMGASKANSGIIHTGYFTKGPMKEEMNLKGAPLFDEVCPQIGVDYDRIGAIFCATDEEELKILKNELKTCESRNIPVELIEEQAKIQEMEPQLNDKVIAVLHFPTAGIIIPFELAVGLAEHAVMNGVHLMLDYEVAIIKREHGMFTISDSMGNKKIETKTVINAAGIYSDKIAKMVGVEDFIITPRRGEYILFDKNSLKFNKIIFPTPSLQSKGIVISKTLHENFFIGPNAHEIDSKEGNQTTIKGLNEILMGAKTLIKDLPLRQNITNFAGVRATSDNHDFIIEPTKVPHFIQAAGIDSPGLSSCLAIARKIEEILTVITGYSFKKKTNYISMREKPARYATLSKEQLEQKVKENPQWGQIICRCELVTEAEIVDACHRPIPCTNSDMIKRRLRPGMGRCQGGFCLPKVMKIISREHGIIYERVTKSGKNSHIVFDRSKGLCSEVFQGEKV
jgi:glycerol-3-phosphate dehydrogenase